MPYDFDKIIDRLDTDSIKYDFAVKRGMPEGVLPLWVADMDFQAPDEVIDALIEKSKHGIFGYSESREDYFEVLKNWFLKNFDWEIRPQWLIKTPGVVYAVTMAIRAFAKEGEGIMIQEPVYYPFRESIEANKRKVVINQLLYLDGKYSIDFDDFEQKIASENVKVFILCSPHNPVGRVWKKDDLIRLGNICIKHNVVVVSDEIHADFIYPSYKHYVFANLDEKFANITITCTAPSKTFNLAGLQISNVFISNNNLKKTFKEEITKSGFSQMNIMGMVACKAAYDKGEQWLIELREYLSENLKFVKNFIKEKLPKVKLIEPEGTYLIWLDFSEYNISDDELDNIIIHRANLWLDNGRMFGIGGEGFQRINIACPRSILKQALTKLYNALDAIGCD